MNLEVKDSQKDRVQLYLQQNYDSVVLIAKDCNGNNWNLLTFDNDGTVTGHAYIDESLGFDLDGDERLIITPEEP